MPTPVSYQGTTSVVPISRLFLASRAGESGPPRSAAFALRGVKFSPRGICFSDFFSQPLKPTALVAYNCLPLAIVDSPAMISSARNPLGGLASVAKASHAMIPAALTLLAVVPPNWSANWAWGLPLIVLTVIIHVLGLGIINRRIAGLSNGVKERRFPTAAFVMIMGATTLSATFLHGVEVAIWATAYRLLGALPDARSAMLYSLNAMTSYGHENLSLQGHWQLMGAMEALNGWLLFGLTTAFLFGIIEKVGSFREKHR
jgi:hypothetical protein